MMMDKKLNLVITCFLMLGVAFAFDYNIETVKERELGKQSEVSFEQMATMYIRP